MAPSGWLTKVTSELGITTLLSSSKDVWLLLFTRFIRMFAYGSSTLILAIYFAALGQSDTRIGLFMTLTLVGDVAISLALTLVADALGRRRILISGSVLMAMSGVVFALTENYWILLLAAVVGVISPSGNEIGPFRAVEESTLAHLSEASTRSDIFAWYVVIGIMGTASGSLACGWITETLQNHGWQALSTYKLIFWMYASIGIAKAAISLLLSRRCEAEPEPKPPADENELDEVEPFLADGQPSQEQPRKQPPPAKKKSPLAQLSQKSRVILLKLCGLFFFDSLGSGMVPNSLIAFYMERKFGMPEGQLGSIMSGAQFVGGVFNIFASSLSKRIGFIKTMVFTHLPSAIMLALLPAPSSLAFTIVLLVARASLSSMDQAPRSAFLSAVVLPQERTATMGIVNTVKTMSQSSGPLITGVLAGAGRFWIAFAVAGALKAGYDLAMLKMFLKVKLEGDRGAHQEMSVPNEEVEDREQTRSERESADTERSRR